ncbi:MAG TPA: hypothetical protein VNB91_06400 [Jatrophihabitantaceae bacterium]|nr:hypothetical protein [Jatrophihabitantaceae bacterium]
MGRRLALLVATYQYQDTGLRRLTAPAHDAEAFAAVLADPVTDVAGRRVEALEEGRSRLTLTPDM